MESLCPVSGGHQKRLKTLLRLTRSSSFTYAAACATAPPAPPPPILALALLTSVCVVFVSEVFRRFSLPAFAFVTREGAVAPDEDERVAFVAVAAEEEEGGGV